MRRFEINKHDALVFFEADIITIARLSRKTRKGEKTELSPRQMYVMETTWYFNEIKHKLADLSSAYLFMSAYPSIKSWRSKMNREEYYLYHYESYLNSMVGLFDRMLHLVNHVYGLGLSDNNVKLEIISTNSRVDKGIKSALKKYDGFLQRQEIKKSRNSASHKERPRMAQFNDPVMLEMSAGLFLTSDVDRADFLKLSKIMYGKLIKEMNTEILAHIVRVEESVSALLSMLHPKIKKDYLTYSV